MRRLERLRILHTRTPTGVELQLSIAEGFVPRLLGLAGLASLPPERGIFLPHCRSVHTLGMRCAIDVVFVRAEIDAGVLEVIDVRPELPPLRVASCADARVGAVELAAGQAATLGVEPAARLAVTER